MQVVERVQPRQAEAVAAAVAFRVLGGDAEWLGHLGNTRRLADADRHHLDQTVVGRIREIAQQPDVRGERAFRSLTETIDQFESALAKYLGAKHVLGVADGTMALGTRSTSERPSATHVSPRAWFSRGDGNRRHSAGASV